MKKIFTALSLLIVACVLFFSMARAVAQQDDKSFGYRYRLVFEVTDEIGKMKIHVYTNTWIYTGNSDVWMGNPHPDILQTPYFGSVIVPGGCIMLVGRGIYIEERPDGIENRTEHHDGYMTISHPITLYDFKEKRELKLEHSPCRNRLN